jgi:hypothetical protein
MCLSLNLTEKSTDVAYEVLNNLLGIKIYTHLIPTGLIICRAIVGNKIGFQKGFDLVEDMEKSCRLKDGKIDICKYNEWKKDKEFEVEIDELSAEDKEKVKYQFQEAERRMWNE